MTPAEKGVEGVPLESSDRMSLSIALRYLPGVDEAPIVLVSGQGEIARGIVLLARSLRIPVVSEPDLSRKLLRVPPGHPVPEELYEAVAVILAALFVSGSPPSPGKGTV
ncbi:MAG: EscU/YscU/HrcU family type III secretion system export apparatus switch protein [Leptospirales bacterium]